jgi:glycosyltransferase involved in cell wall biosynthesis
MKILFLPNWTIKQAEENILTLQSPDKYIRGEKYWFFRYFSEDTQVDVIDIHAKNILHRVEVKIKFYIWQAILAFKNERKYDVVISHGAQSGLVYSLLRTLFFRKQPKHIIFDIGGMNGARNNKIENALIKFALHSNPHIICHSKVIIANYKKMFPKLVSQTRFIPFGIDVEDFTPQPDVEEKNYVFSFGSGKRDYETLIEAWTLIRNNNFFSLRIAGVPPLEMAKDCENIEFIGRVSINCLKAEIQAARFVVIPLPVFNYSYGQMSFLQSMCLGKTVVVTETPSSVDYIEDGNGAFFVEPYNSENLRNKIEMLLSDKPLLEKNNKKAHDYVLSNFTEEKMGLRIYKFAKQIIK